MKFLKFLVFITAIAMMLSMVGCDLAAIVDDALGGSDPTTLEGGNANTDGEDGNGDNADGGTQATPDHVCDYKLQSKTDSTCEVAGEENYKCSCGKTQKKTLSLLPHTEVTDPAEAPTATAPGKTEGKHCSVCGVVIIKQEYVFAGDYAVVEKYDGDYAYDSLSKLANGEKLTQLYNLIDKEADLFHKGTVDAQESEEYIIANVDYSSLGLTADEAIAVWCAYRIDRPLYYWISNNIYYTSKELSIVCDTDYAKATDRASLNAKIYAGVKEYVEEGYSNSKYNTALAFHDLIILAIDYAYEADGTTPEDAAWAHNIIGVFDKGAGVCESYSKTFQLLLNYCDIENVFVSGQANEAHAWNLVKLDDGQWYWFDLTWDDTPDFMWGISYRYFCVNDNENVGWTDGPFTMDAATFLSTHTPNNKVDTGINYNYELPTRSTTEFSDSEIMLRDTFDIGNLTYAIAGYNSVQLVATKANGEINIPSSVSYLGKNFKVISIGKMDNGRFTVGSIASSENGWYTVNSVSIPDSVIFIWDDVFYMDELISITVSSDNKHFASRDGVLFTKDFSVLIKYPDCKEGKNYTLPEETKVIAAGAFRTSYTYTKLNLEKIYLTSSDITSGVRNYGYRYESKEYLESNPWDAIRAELSGEALIYDKDGFVLTEK